MMLKTKLISAFSLTVLLIATMAGICIYTTWSIGSAFERVTNEAVPKFIILDTVKTSLLRMEVEAIGISLIQGEIEHITQQVELDKRTRDVEEEIEEFEGAYDEIEELIASYEQLPLPVEEQVLAQQLRLSSQQFQQQCLILIETMLGQPLLRLSNKKRLEEAEESLVNIIDAAILSARKDTAMTSQIAHDKAYYSFLLNSIVTILAISLAILLAYKTTRTIVRLDQDKNDFFSIVVHDLKNPLAAILGMADMIREEVTSKTSTDEELIEYSQIIQNSAKSMFQLITNLLEVNTIELGKLKLLIEPTDILPIVQKVIRDYTKRAQDKEITLHLKTTHSRYMAAIDKNTTHQILDNLISNAIKYSPIGKEINICLIEDKNCVRCEVQDEGIGLSSEDQRRLFGKFVRLTPKPTANESSNGLGLFIVKKFIEAMNGKVWCESELGKGTKFVVEFFCPK